MLQFGYSPETISANIRKEIRNGKAYHVAIAIAYQHARDSWHIRHPGKALPKHLRKKHR